MIQPTVILHGVDAGDSYYFWQWVHGKPGEPSTHVISRSELKPLLAQLDESLPGSATTAGAGGDMFNRGVFADFDTELAFSSALSRVALPRELADTIVTAAGASSCRVLLRVQPSPSCSKIPWELLTVGDGPNAQRLMEYADIVIDPPPDINSDRTADPADWTPEYAAGPAVYVIDPLTDGVAGPVLSGNQQLAFVQKSPPPDNPAPGHAFDRQTLSTLLRSPTRPSRLFYLGHVASSTSQPGASALLLSDSASSFGVTDLVEGNGKAIRPLSAFDLIEGTWRAPLRLPALLRTLADDEVLVWPDGSKGSRTVGAEIWPMPARVALVACNSGGDLAHPEPFGLVIAMLNAGAGLITATRWTLPTDFALHEAVPGTADDQPLFDMAVLIDEAHRADDPVPVISEWQRGRLAAWKRSNGAQQHSPIFWASLTTYLAPKNPPVPIPPEELSRLLGA